nr:MAG TPA: hypothetical protein [Crassvirales sp.]
MCLVLAIWADSHREGPINPTAEGRSGFAGEVLDYVNGKKFEK